MLVYFWLTGSSDLWSLIVGQLGQQVIFPLECCRATPPTRHTAVEISLVNPFLSSYYQESGFLHASFRIVMLHLSTSENQ